MGDTGIEDIQRRLDQIRSELEAKQAEVCQLQRTLEERQRELLYFQKMAALGSLIAGILHEIKTPIGAINSMQDTLGRAVTKLKRTLGDACPEEVMAGKGVQTPLRLIDEASKVIASGSSRTLDIVRRVQRFARMDATTLREADLHAELDDTLLLIHHHIKNRIAIVKHYGEIPRVTCNVGQVNQVMLNLLVNASQAIEDRGTITITTEHLADRALVRVEVADTGAGIAPEHLERLFEPGFTTKKVGAGTGLGLSICAKIVNDHRGTIDVRSALGRGTTVSLTLSTRLAEQCCGKGDPG